MTTPERTALEALVERWDAEVPTLPDNAARITLQSCAHELRAALAAADQRGMERCPHCRGTGVNVSDCICSHTPPDQPTPPATAHTPEPSPSAALVEALVRDLHRLGYTSPDTRARVQAIADAARLEAAPDAVSLTEAYEHGLAAARAEGLDGLRSALESMVRQFGYWGSGGYTTGGLSALEDAFEALGWEEPHNIPTDQCDEPGCLGQVTTGWSDENGRFRTTCGSHYRDAARARRPEGEGIPHDLWQPLPRRRPRPPTGG